MAVVESSEGEGRYIGCQASTTNEIPSGRIVEYDTNGYIVLPTTTPNVDQQAGISATKKASQTTASLKDIVVQQTGMAPIVCTANDAFAVGKYVRSATAGTGAGYASTVAEATTITATALEAAIGKVVIADATTEGTTVVVQLGI